MRRTLAVWLGLATAGVLAIWWARSRPPEAGATATPIPPSAPAKPSEAGLHGVAPLALKRAVTGDPYVSASGAGPSAENRIVAGTSREATRGTPRAVVVETPVSTPAASDRRALSAEEILRTMRENYARLTSYTDRGRLTRTWHEANRIYADVSFRTFFKRPLLYRFEWLGDRDPYRNSYWSNAAGVFSKHAHDTPLLHSSFPALFTYPSLDAPYHVLQWLTPAAARPDIGFFTGATRLEDEFIDGVACFHLSGTTSRHNHERHLWIGQEDFLLRRIRTIGPYAYNLSSTPRYGSGMETVQIDYFDVTTELTLPDELFLSPAAK